MDYPYKITGSRTQQSDWPIRNDLPLQIPERLNVKVVPS